MNRHVVFIGAIALVLAASLVEGQGRQGGGGGQAPQINWNQRMPWGPLEAAVRLRWAGYPLTDQRTEPFKVFDNVYYVGIQIVGSYLITTSAGLILVDTTYAETGDLVMESIRKLGLDPANIKYILITHQHADHFAGAGRIKQVATGARIGMSQADWEGVERLQTPGQGGNQNVGIALTRDLVIKDGETITLGDTTLKVYVTPGHTPGSLAIDVPAKADGRTFRALIPNTGINPSPDLTRPYIASMERLKQMGPWDAVLPVHGFLAQVDLPLEPRDLVLAARQPAPRPKTAHPAALGPAKINQYFDAMLKVAREKLAAEQPRATSSR
jgi:glyoxylase-like metal-dependent hydrolase (beta-lactamase superfamily II)